MGWLAGHRPDLVERYRKLYRSGAYAPREERARLEGMVRRGRPSDWRSRFAGTAARSGSATSAGPAPAGLLGEPAPAGRQESLF